MLKEERWEHLPWSPMEITRLSLQFQEPNVFLINGL